MPHSTRKNYKSKLEEKDPLLVETILEGVSTADAIYATFEKENVARRELYSETQTVGEMAIDVVKKLDMHRNVGGLKFSVCEEVNDDCIRVYDAYSILDRVFDILMIAEERIEILAERLDESTSYQAGLNKRLATLSKKLEDVHHRQHEAYYVGENPTETEISTFEEAESKGGKYKRSPGAKNSMLTKQKHNGGADGKSAVLQKTATLAIAKPTPA